MLILIVPVASLVLFAIASGIVISRSGVEGLKDALAIRRAPGEGVSHEPRATANGEPVAPRVAAPLRPGQRRRSRVPAAARR